MNWYIDKFANDIKETITKKMDLIALRENSRQSLIRAEDYFSDNNKSSAEILAGIGRLREIIKELNELDRAIVDVDVIIVSKIEMYTANFEAKFKMPDRLNDAGDLIKHNEVYAVPFNSDSDRKEVTPDDIWFLKMIRDAYKATNITFTSK